MNIRHLPLPCLPGFRPPGIGTGRTAATIPETTRDRPLPGQHRRKVRSRTHEHHPGAGSAHPHAGDAGHLRGTRSAAPGQSPAHPRGIIEKFSNQVGKDREKDLAKARANREEDRKALKDFRTEVLDRFDANTAAIAANTTAIAANTTAIAANTTAIAVNAAETNGNIALNTTKIDAIAANTAAIAANGATHDRNIRKVGDQVAGFAERVSRVEGYIEATSSRRPQPVTTSR